MDLKRLAAAAAAIATSIGLPALTGGVAPVNAAPLDPPPVDPGGPVDNPAPAPPHGLQPFTPRPPVMRVGPGGPKGGGGQPSYEQPHHAHPAPPVPPPPPPGG